MTYAMTEQLVTMAKVVDIMKMELTGRGRLMVGHGLLVREGRMEW